MKVRDEFGAVSEDASLARAGHRVATSRKPPWRLALMTVLKLAKEVCQIGGGRRRRFASA